MHKAKKETALPTALGGDCVGALCLPFLDVNSHPDGKLVISLKSSFLVLVFLQDR